MRQIVKTLGIIIITMLFMVCLSTTTVFAGSGGNGTGDDGSSSASKHIDNGPAASKQFWLVYICDASGKTQSSVIMLNNQEFSTTYTYIQTRPEHGSIAPSSIILGSEFGWSYDSNGNSRGSEVKAWMLSQDTTSGQCKGMTVIEKLWGKETAQKFVDKDWYLCLENGMFCNIYKDAEGNTRESLASTAYGWGLFQQQNNIGDIGSKWINLYTNDILPNSTKLEFAQTGLAQPTGSGKLTNTEIMSAGYGMLLIWSSEMDTDDSQTTYDESLGDTPGKPADESDGEMTIVKNYRIKNADGSYTDSGCFNRKTVASKIKIENEKSYKVVGYKTSDSTNTFVDSISWNVPGNIKKSGTKGNKIVNLGKNEKTLYVLLEKVDTTVSSGDYDLAESQITKAVSLDTTEKGEALLSGHDFTWNMGALTTCAGHKVVTTEAVAEVPDDPKTPDVNEYKAAVPEVSETKYCTFTLDDNSLTVGVKNTSLDKFPNNIAYNSFWQVKNPDAVTITRTSVDAESNSQKFSQSLVLHRGSDALTIAQWKNSNDALTSLNNFNLANSKTPSRKTEDYSEKITLTFEDDSTDKTTTANGDRECANSDEASLSETFTKDLNIFYHTYSGNGNITSSNNDSYGLQDFSSGNTINVGYTLGGQTIEFFPYIQMRYDTLESKNNKVYVLGEYKRTLELNSAVNVVWKKSTTPNLLIGSLQFSTHKAAVDAHGMGTVLPGGSTFTLSIPKTNRQTFTVTTMEPMLKGAGLAQVNATGSSSGSITKEDALKAHADTVQSVIKNLRKVGVVQWENDNVEASPFKGIQISSGSDIRSLKNGSSTSSSDEKYYLAMKAGEGLIDVDAGNTKTSYYSFKTDVLGNVYMNDEIILTKDQNASNLTNATAIEINNSTKIVTKLCSNLERNQGNDKGADWVTDGKWYSESFDGVTYAVSKTTIQTGFVDPLERTCVLDPKLIPKNEGVADNFSKFYIMGFKSITTLPTNGKYYEIGTYKGNTLYTKGLQNLYYSNEIYIPNITTQDLK